MEDRIANIWVYLAHTPLLWLVVTLLIYQAAYALHLRANARSILNPVLVAILLIVLLLIATGTPYEAYFEGAQFIHFLLGPATVALAIPLYTYTKKVQQMALPILGALLVGSAAAVISVVGVGQLLGVSQLTLLSLAPKSVTTPIAMGISEKVGGVPSLTAVLVILTGILGAVLGKELLDVLRIRDDSIRGFAIGLASHGIGTARAFQISEETGAFSGLGMGLNGVATAVLAPILARLLGLI